MQAARSERLRVVQRAARRRRRPVDLLASLLAVAFRPDTLKGADPTGPGEVDYRLARQSLISQFRKGRLARHELCDAHPELVRAARECGDVTSQICPICEDANVVLVSYVFGPRLPPFGRCITNKRELSSIAKGSGSFACYVVEVCPACSWNHLARTFLLNPAKPRAASR